MVPKIKYFLIYMVNIYVMLSAATRQGEAYELFLKGEYEMLQYNFNKAEKHFTSALSLSPDSPTILQSLVDIKSYQGEYSAAIGYMEEIMKLEPDNKNFGLTFYMLLIQEGDSIRAESVLDSLLIYHPGDHDILFSRANIQFADKNWPDLLNTYKSIYISDTDQDEFIIKIYEIGISTGNIELVREILWELKPLSKDRIISDLLIEISNNTGEYLEAIDLMQELIQAKGATDELRIRLGEFNFKAEQFKEVINILQPIYKTGNHSLDILRMLLISYSLLGQTDKEIHISQTLLREYPKLSIGYEALSFAYLQSGSNEKAIEVLLQALSNFPDEAAFPYLLATILSSSGDYMKAESYFYRTLSIQPDLVSAQHSLAMMYEEMNDTSRSDSLFLYMIQQDNNDAIGHNDYAYILSEREEISIEKLQFALELVESAIAIEPDNAAFLDTIGWIYYKLGTYQKAEEYLEKSLSINNNNPVILEHLGDIYFKLNKLTEAVNIYEKILLIDSDNHLIKDKINKIYE